MPAAGYLNRLPGIIARCTFLLICLSSQLYAQGVYSLWGMTAEGGPENKGVIFRTDDRGNNYQVMHEFTGGARYPYGTLVFYNGKLYGSGQYGDNGNQGVIFEIDPLTGQYQDRYISIDPAATYPANTTMYLFNGKFYGADYSGNNGLGSVFEWDPATNNYTRKFLFTGTGGNYPGRSMHTMLLVNNRFYGYALTESGEGLFFEWDPVTNIFTKKLDLPNPFGIGKSIVSYQGKIYGTTIGDGATGLGTIFEWDPGSNNFVTRINFNIHSLNTGTPGVEGGSPIGGLTLSDGKLYGTALDGGMNGVGVLWEWDPVTNIPAVKQDLDDFTTGKWPTSPVMSLNHRLYGLINSGGANGKGLLFEYDLSQSLFTNRIDFDGVNAWYATEGNSLTAVPAAIASPAPGNCVDFPDITIGPGDTFNWMPITDSQGYLLAELNANGNDIGTIQSSAFIQSGPIREDQARRMYLNRNISITPERQPATPVSLRLYVTENEFSALRLAHNSLGEASGINVIGDLSVFTNADPCGSVINAGASAVPGTVQSWNSGYVFTTQVDHFSSFYFASSAATALPVRLLQFIVRAQEQKVLLTWQTQDETDASHFTIERSADGINYQEIADVAAANEPGVHDYRFTDGNAQAGLPLYYRLKIIDRDGHFSISNILRVQLDLQPAMADLFPNPVLTSVHVKMNLGDAGSVSFRIFDLEGRTIKTGHWQLPAGESVLSVDVGGMAAGCYIMQVEGKAVRLRSTFMKQ